MVRLSRGGGEYRSCMIYLVAHRFQSVSLGFGSALSRGEVPSSNSQNPFRFQSCCRFGLNCCEVCAPAGGVWKMHTCAAELSYWPLKWLGMAEP